MKVCCARELLLDFGKACHTMEYEQQAQGKKNCVILFVLNNELT